MIGCCWHHFRLRHNLALLSQLMSAMAVPTAAHIELEHSVKECTWLILLLLTQLILAMAQPITAKIGLEHSIDECSRLI